MTAETSTMTVELEGFTARTADWLRERFGCVGEIPIARAVHLLVELGDEPEEQFPGGKWAIIQHLEGCITNAITHLVAERDKARANIKDFEGLYGHWCELLRPYKSPVESIVSPGSIIPRLIERMEFAEATLKRIGEVEK